MTVPSGNWEVGSGYPCDGRLVSGIKPDLLSHLPAGWSFASMPLRLDEECVLQWFVVAEQSLDFRGEAVVLHARLLATKLGIPVVNLPRVTTGAGQNELRSAFEEIRHYVAKSFQKKDDGKDVAQSGPRKRKRRVPKGQVGPRVHQVLLDQAAKIRKGKKISLREMAKLSGCSEGAVSGSFEWQTYLKKRDGEKSPSLRQRPMTDVIRDGLGVEDSELKRLIEDQAADERNDRRRPRRVRQ